MLQAVNNSRIITTFAQSSTITSADDQSGMSNQIFVGNQPETLCPSSNLITQESNHSHFGTPTSEAVNHRSTRTVAVPIRYRHSIGSPSLQTSGNNYHPETEYVFGNDEVDRFFDREVNLPLNFDTTELKPDSLKEVLSTLKSSFDSLKDPKKN